MINKTVKLPQMLKKVIIASIILLFGSGAHAQKPAWADYYERQEMYPGNEFLVGFVSGENSNGEDAGTIKSKYEALSKDKVVQSIQVEIESYNTLEISNVNAKSGEEFLSKSVSFSKANINGMTTLSFYDRKKKEVYAISYVNKKELAFFYRNTISSSLESVRQKLGEGRKYANKADKENALRSFYEAMPFINKIDEASVLLTALNRKMYADINMGEVNKLKLELINEIDAILKPSGLDLSESAYFAAYGIFLQLGKIDGKINLSGFTFENTGLESRFSEKWNDEFAAALVKAGKYVVDRNNSGPGKYSASGNYWQEGDYLKLNVDVSMYGKIIAVSKASIPLSYLKNESIGFIPAQISKMKLLSMYELSLISAPEIIKLGMATTEPIKIGVLKKSPDEDVVVQNIPVRLVNAESGLSLGFAVANKDGIAEFYLPPLNSGKKVMALEAGLNIARYFDVDENSVYFAIAENKNPLKAITFNINTAKPTVYVQSIEKTQNRKLDIKTLEPAVKELLAEKSYNFVDTENEADFIVRIKANTTSSTNYRGIYFAYLDANISVVEASSGEEVYKTQLDQIKGGGANYTKAARKAYFVGAQRIKAVLEDVF